VWSIIELSEQLSATILMVYKLRNGERTVSQIEVMFLIF
jgi:hypothetical protein